MSCVVVGSVNVDFDRQVDADTVARLDADPAVPAVGETRHVTTPPAGFDGEGTLGGKGANQAVAAARAGVDTVLCGAVGRDAEAFALRSRLADGGVDTRLATRGDRTGAAYVWVEPDGENRIALLAGANGQLTTADAERHLRRARAAEVVLVQNEVPVAATTALLDGLAGTPEAPTVVVDPAPADGAAPLVTHPAVDVCVPNETEFDTLRSSLAAAHRRGVCVVRTEGADGATVFGSVDGGRGDAGSEDADSGGDAGNEGGDDGHTTFSQPTFRVDAPSVGVVDTTGAGDALAGSLAAALCDGVWETAVRRGVRAGSRACRHTGATDAV